MKVSAKAQYACMAMIELAAVYEDGRLVRIKTISEHHSISSRFLVQILLQLKTAGLVTSARGATGGYQLSRSPEEITVSDVLKAVEDRTGDPLPEENSATAQVLGSVWREVHTAEQKILTQHTLADLLIKINQPNDITYQI